MPARQARSYAAPRRWALSRCALSINVASDIVLDVARAADPAKYRAAVDRLTKPGQGTGAQAASFVDELSDLARRLSRLPNLPQPP